MFFLYLNILINSFVLVDTSIVNIFDNAGHRQHCIFAAFSESQSLFDLDLISLFASWDYSRAQLNIDFGH